MTSRDALAPAWLHVSVALAECVHRSPQPQLGGSRAVV